MSGGGSDELAATAVGFVIAIGIASIYAVCRRMQVSKEETRIKLAHRRKESIAKSGEALPQDTRCLGCGFSEEFTGALLGKNDVNPITDCLPTWTSCNPTCCQIKCCNGFLWWHIYIFQSPEKVIYWMRHFFCVWISDMGLAWNVVKYWYNTTFFRLSMVSLIMEIMITRFFVTSIWSKLSGDRRVIGARERGPLDGPMAIYFLFNTFDKMLELVANAYVFEQEGYPISGALFGTWALLIMCNQMVSKVQYILAWASEYKCCFNLWGAVYKMAVFIFTIAALAMWISVLTQGSEEGDETYSNTNCRRRGCRTESDGDDSDGSLTADTFATLVFVSVFVLLVPVHIFLVIIRGATASYKSFLVCCHCDPEVEEGGHGKPKHFDGLTPNEAKQAGKYLKEEDEHDAEIGKNNLKVEPHQEEL